MCQSYCKIQPYFSSTRTHCAHSLTTQCLLKRALFSHCSPDQYLLSSSAIPRRSWSIFLPKGAWSLVRRVVEASFLRTNIPFLLTMEILWTGCSRGGEKEREWCVDWFSATKDFGCGVVDQKGCLSGEKEEVAVEGCVRRIGVIMIFFCHRRPLLESWCWSRMPFRGGGGGGGWMSFRRGECGEEGGGGRQIVVQSFSRRQEAAGGGHSLRLYMLVLLTDWQPLKKLFS